VADVINAKLAEINPGMQMTGPMVETLIKSIMIMGMAELVDVASPAIGDRLPIKADKLDAISEFMREYAGEKFGNEIVELAIKMVPLVMGAFAQFSVEDIKAATPHSEDEEDEHDDVEEEQIFTPPSKLDEDEEDEEEREEIVQVSKKIAKIRKS